MIMMRFVTKIMWDSVCITLGIFLPVYCSRVRSCFLSHA